MAIETLQRACSHFLLVLFHFAVAGQATLMSALPVGSSPGFDALCRLFLGNPFLPTPPEPLRHLNKKSHCRPRVGTLVIFFDQGFSIEAR